MLSDAWERKHVQSAGLHTDLVTDLTLLAMITDRDKDGSSDLAEYLADTNPFDAGDTLRIVTFRAEDISTDNVTLEWTSSPRRTYNLESTLDLIDFNLEFSGLTGALGPTTAITFTEPLLDRRFWRVTANPHLSP